MAKKNNKSSKKCVLGTWMARIWKGSSAQLADEMDEKAKNMAVEEIVSPLQQVIRNFMDRKLAVGALVLLIATLVIRITVAAVFDRHGERRRK